MRKNIEKLIQWSRYLYRTCKIQNMSEKEFKNDENHSKSFPNEMFLLFLALLYVTIEAFGGEP